MERLYTMLESSDVLRVSISSIRAWVFQKRIPVTRIGRRVFIRESILNDIINKGLEKGILGKK